MDDLAESLNKKEDAIIDDYIEMLKRTSTSILKKIKEREPLLFAHMMSEMALIYRSEEELKALFE